MKPTLLVVPALLLLMSACGGGEADDQVNDYTGQANSSGCTSQYADQEPQLTRQQAASDVQCSSYVAAADSYLETARAHCASGASGDAQRVYSNYLTMARYAEENVAMLCGGDAGGGIVPGGSGGSGSGSGETADVTLYVQYSTTNGTTVLGGRCTNMGAPADGTNYYWYAAASHMTMDECKAKGAEYGLSF